MPRNVGRVVKNARVNTQRYQVAVPRIDSNGYHDDDDELHFSPVVETPRYEPIEEPPASIDADGIAQMARHMVDLAETRAKALIDDAHTRAGQLIAEAAARAETLVESTRSQAHDEGFAAGTAAADQQMSDMMATMRNLVDLARIERHKLIEEAEPELVRLAMGIAERVLHQQIALDRGVVVEMAKVAIARLVDRETVTVRVNPADLERMRDHRDAFLSAGDIKNLRIIEDQRVDRGGVVVETDGGTIDARVGTQLAQAKRVLRIEDEVVVQPADRSDSDMRTARVG